MPATAGIGAGDRLILTARPPDLSSPLSSLASVGNWRHGRRLTGLRLLGRPATASPVAAAIPLRRLAAGFGGCLRSLLIALGLLLTLLLLWLLPLLRR
jgi:hypothetical protein